MADTQALIERLRQELQTGGEYWPRVRELLTDAVAALSAQEAESAALVRRLIDGSPHWLMRVAQQSEIARLCSHDGFWSVEVREGAIVAVIKLVQERLMLPTGDDASREAAKRMSVRGPSPTTFCQCGHPRDQHGAGDSPPCRVCYCKYFVLMVNGPS